MRIFLSYPSSRRAKAEDIAYALQAQRHDVFFDKDDLPAGQSYIQRIQDEIEACDLFIFVVTPASLEEGRFTLTELGIARKAWSQPTGRVLPVMIEPTPFHEIPAFLRSVTMLIPEGNAAAEVVLAVEDMAAALAGERAERVSTRADDGGTEEFRWSYQAIEIRLGPGVAQQYDVSVSEVSGGDTYSGSCSFDAPALEEQLRSSAGAIEGSVQRARPALGETAENLMPSAGDAQAVGASLYQSLLASPIRPGLEVRAAELDPQRGEGLRFLINMTEAPDLARLPWEFLYDARQDDFIFLDPMKTVIRTLDVNRPAPSLAVQSPVRLLVAVAAPEGGPELEVGQEIAQMDRALNDLVKEQRVEIQRLNHTGLEDLDEALLELKPHVLHFIGHGGFDGNDGVIVLEEPTREPDPVTGRQLGVLLRNHLGSLRLVFLNSCLGAAIPVGDPLGGVAQNLIRRGVPAVIAMQFPIPDRDAVALARHFYRYLAAGRTVDAALTSARAFLFADGRAVEWGAPALYMQAGGALFPDQAPTRPTPQLAPELQLPPSSGPPDVELDGVPIEPGVAAAAARPYDKVAKLEGEADVSLERRRRPTWLWVTPMLIALIATVVVLWVNRDEELILSPGAFPATTIVSPTTTIVSPTTTVPLIPTTGTTVLPADPSTLALQVFEEGDAREGLRLLEEAREADPNFERVDPATSEALVAVLIQEADEELAFQLVSFRRPQDLAFASRLANMVVALDEDNPDGLALIAALETLRSTREVAPGDSLWKIADEVYQDPLLWITIFSANQEQIADPDLIFPDQRLVVPPRPEPHVPPASGTYVVVEGDSLWSIAEVEYGDPLRWVEIFDANEAQIVNPDLIFPHQILVIP